MNNINTGGYILVAGAANLDVIANVSKRGAQNNHTGKVALEFGGCGFNMAQNLAKQDQDIVFMTALHADGLLNQLLRNEFEELGIRSHIIATNKISDSVFAGIFCNGEMESSVLQESLCNYNFEPKFLESGISKASALFITAELSKQSLKDSIQVANKSNIPVFLAGCSVEEVTRIDFDTCNVDYLFLNEKECIDFAKLLNLPSINHLAEKINTTIIMTQGSDGVSVITSNITNQFPIHEIEVKGNILGAGDYFMSSFSRLISQGESLEDAINITMQGIANVLGRTQANTNPENALRDKLQHITNSTHKDPMTKALNRDGLVHTLTKLDFINDKYFLAVIDIDDFKKVNDNYGHSAGDHIIKYVVDCLTINLRNCDAVSRWGGEEFVIVFNVKSDIENDYEQAFVVLDRLRKSINSIDHEVIDNNKVSVSIGSKRLDSQHEFDDIFDLADEALYEAKKNGKNRVEFSINS